MASEPISRIISQEALDTFDIFIKKVSDSTAALEKLIAEGVELNKTFANVKALKDLVDVTEKLKASEEALRKEEEKNAIAQEKLRQAAEERAKREREAADSTNKSRQATVDSAKATNEQAQSNLKSAVALRDLNKQLVDVTLTLKAITEARKGLTKSFQEGRISEDEYKTALTDLLDVETSLKNTSSELRTATKNVAKEMDAAEGSIVQLESQLKIAQQAYKALSDEEKSSDIGKATKDQIRSLSDEVNKQKKSIGDFSSNVGRYAESLGGLFDGVQREIQNLNRQKVTAFNRGDEQAVRRYEAAIGELQNIEKISLNTNLSYTQSVRQLNKEFINVASAGNQSTEFIRELKNALGEAVDRQQDLKDEIKLAASDTKTFDLLSGAVNGLVGAYQTAIGVQALFGEQNEENEKTIKRLVAVQSVANGVQQIAEQLTNKTTLAYRALAYVQGLYKIATDASATATQRLGAAFTGIGIGLLIAAIAYVIINFDKLFKSIDPVISQFDKLDGVTREAKEQLKAYGDTAEKITEGVLKDLKDQIKSLNDELGLTKKPAELAGIQVRALESRLTQLKKTSEIYRAEIGKSTENYATYNGLLSANAKEITNVEEQLKKLGVTLDEFNQKQSFLDAGEFLKARSAALVQQFKDVQDANNRILALQSTSESQRINLLQSNFALEKIIIDRAYQAELAAADGNAAKIYAADAKFKSDMLKAERDFQDNTDKVRREYRERNAKAVSEQAQRELQLNIDKNNKIADDETKLPEIRLRALRNSLVERLTLLNEQKSRELAVEGLTAQEKQNINDKYNKLREATEKEIYDKIFKIQLDYFTKVPAEQGRMLREMQKQLQQYAKDVAKVFQEIGVDVSQADFMKDVTNAVKEANKNIKGQFDDLEEIVAGFFDRAKENSPELFDQGVKELTQNLKNLAAEFVNVGAAVVNAKFENQKNEIAQQIELIDKRRDAEIAAIEASAKSEQEKADAIAVINARSDAQKREQERRQKQVSIQQARFQKAVTIAGIIAETALAVIKAFSTYGPTPLGYANAAAIGALGIAQAAVVAATPVPQYFAGTDFHQGGKAIVGDGGRSELIVTPQGKLVETPNVPTLIDLQRGSKVLPDAAEAMANYYGGMTVQKFNQLASDNKDVVNEMRGLRKDIKNMPQTKFVQKGNNWETIVDRKGNIQRWIKQNID